MPPTTSRGRKGFARRAVAALAVSAAAAVLVPTATRLGSSSVMAADARPSTAAMVAGLREVNYYPVDNGWANMWTNWQPAVFQADMQRIANLGANTVRIIVNTAAFGYPSPDPAMVEELQSAVAMADQAGLRSHITLFDGFSGYSDVAGSRQWAAGVLDGLAGDTRVALVELQNELVPSDQTAVGWARQMLPWLRTEGAGIPVTVSVTEGADPYWMGLLQRELGTAQPDFWDVHIYQDPGDAYHVMSGDAQVAAPLPLFVGETGYDTASGNTQFGGAVLTQAWQEAFQAQYYRQFFAAARAAGIAPPAPWMLYDVWKQSMGLFHKDGSPKPAAMVVSQAFHGLDTGSSFNNGFESAAGTVPAVWRTWALPLSSYAIDTTVAHSGSASARISGTVAGGGAIFSETVTPLVGGTAHRVSAWSRGSNVTGTTYVAIQWLDDNGVVISSTRSAALSLGDTAWTQLTAGGTAPANAAWAQVVLVSTQDSGSVWFDDVSFS